jgi:hypothetical protein
LQLRKKVAIAQKSGKCAKKLQLRKKVAIAQKVAIARKSRNCLCSPKSTASHQFT